MVNKILVAFSHSEKQLKRLKRFCNEELNLDSTNVISVQQKLANGSYLSLSVFQKAPYVRFGIFSMPDEKMQTDVFLTDEELEIALKGLALRYAHAVTRKPPVVSESLGKIWVDYIDTKPDDYEYDL